MDKQTELFAPDEGPDYVALVIEWDQLADRLEGEITERTTFATEPVAPLELSPLRVLAAALGALGVLGATWWGIHRMRATAA